MVFFRCVGLGVVLFGIFLALAPFYPPLFADANLAVSTMRWALVPLGILITCLMLWVITREEDAHATSETERVLREERELHRQQQAELKFVAERDESARRLLEKKNHRQQAIAAYAELLGAVVDGKRIKQLGGVVQLDDEEVILLLAAVQLEDLSYRVIGYADGRIEEPRADRCEQAWLLKNLKTFPKLEAEALDVLVWYNAERYFIASYVPDSTALGSDMRSWQFVGHVHEAQGKKSGKSFLP
jgi:hypothetical protein